MIEQPLTLKVGDLKPDFVMTITDPNATFDLVTLWQVVVVRDGIPSITTADVVVLSNSNHTAIVTHLWLPGETDKVTTLGCSVIAIWPNSKPQSFPAVGYELVNIS